MRKLHSRYFVYLFLLVIIGLISIVSSNYGLYSNCEEPACSGLECFSISENDCPSPCFCSREAPGLPLTCNSCSMENCPCSNSGMVVGSIRPCCSGFSCLSYDSEEAAGPGTCGES